jgi:type VI secretion system protein ImpH
METVKIASSPKSLTVNDHFPGVLGARLFREGFMFDFFQSVRLLESMFPEGKSPGESSDIAEERIRFRPHNGLIFPATDVRQVELLDERPKRARLTATFMGLYGVDSPLPVYFYDVVATDAEETKPLRDFLDMFNHRLYSLFYRSWKKYRFGMEYSRPSTRKSFVVRTLSLGGIGTRGVVDDAVIEPIRLAAFVGLLSMRVHNAEGLRNLVAEFLGGVQVSVIENIPRWVVIPRRPRIGEKGPLASSLGQTACIGSRVEDVSGKFRIAIGPLTMEQYLTFLPGNSTARLLSTLVRLYVRDNLDYDVQLKLSTHEIPRYRMGDKAAKLGLTTWLGTPQTTITERVVDYG